MPYKNIEDRRENCKKWRKAHSTYGKEYMKEFRRKDPDYHKNWEIKNKESIKKYRKEHNSKPEVKRYKKEKNLKDRYNLTLNQYQKTLEEQNSKCAICNKSINGVNIHTDHCHKTGKFRGLLCRKCNNGLGLFGDNKFLLENAIKYLEK